MLDLFSQKGIVIGQLPSELLPVAFHLVGIVIVSCCLQDPFLFHQDFIQLSLDLLFPHLDLKIGGFVLLGLFESSRFAA